MNILEFHTLNEYLATSIAILANLLVIFLTVTEKNSTIRAYYKIIMATCLNEFAFCLCSLLTVMYCKISNGAVVFVVGSVLHNVQIQNVHNILFFLYIFKIGIGINIIPAEYYFRYRTVCRKEHLSTFQVLCMLFLGWGYSALNASTFLWAFTRDDGNYVEKYESLLRDPMWSNENGKLPLFVGTQYTTLFVPFSISIIGANGAYMLAINWGLKIYRELNSVKHLMTRKTIRLQKNMTIMLAIQAIFPFMASSLPVCLFILAVTFQLNIPNLGMYMAISAVWMPVVSPLCTILLLGVYRRRILAFFNIGSPTSSRIKALQVTATVTEFSRVTRQVKY